MKDGRAPKFNTLLALSYAVGIVILAAAISVTALSIATNKLRRDLLHYGEGLANNLARESTFSLVYSTADNSRAAIDATLRFPYVTSLSIITIGGDVLFQTSGSTLEISSITQMTWVEGMVALVQEDTQQLHVVAPVFLADVQDSASGSRKTELLGWTHVALDKRRLEQASLDLSTKLTIVTVLVGLILFYALLAIARLITSPLRKMASSMTHTAAVTDYREVDSEGPKEIREIAAAYNHLMRELKAINQDLELRIEERTYALTQSKEEAVRVNQENRRLIHGMNYRLEEERRYIAREIHDQLNAVIVAVRLALQRMQRRLDHPKNLAEAIADTRGSINDVVDMVARTYTIARQIIHRLRPEVIDALGLRGAIEEMVSNYNRLHPSCRFDLTLAGNVDEIGDEASIAIFRIVQEALTNAVKHASATRVRSTILYEKSGGHSLIRVSVEDNGQGFDTKTATQGIGILSMRERALGVGGELNIVSTIPGGTHVNAIIPISGTDHDDYNFCTL